MWPFDANQRFDPVFISALLVLGIWGYLRMRRLPYLLMAQTALLVIVSATLTRGRIAYAVYLALNYLLAIFFSWAMIWSLLKLRAELREKRRLS